MALQIRRGTDAERTAGGGVVFAEGELIYVTDTDALYVGDGSTAGGVKLTDNAGAVLGTYITADTINSTLDLQQNLDLNGNDVVGTGNINITGNINATGNIVAGGNIDIGDAPGDTVTITAQVDSSITPETDTAYDLGTMSKRWRNVYANGATIDGQIDAVAINADVVADNSTVMVDVSANTLTGNLTGDVTGDTAGTHTGSVIGDVTGNTQGYHTGDTKGSVFGDDSTLIIDAVNNTLTGNLTGNVTGNLTGEVTGNVTGSIKGSSGVTVFATNTGPADAELSVFNVTTTGTISGNVTGNVLGNLTGNADGDHTGTFTGAITATGTLDGDVTGSVFADDSALLVDAVAGNIPASVISGTLNNNLVGDVTGTVTGNIITNSIDSSDSSAITVTPQAIFDARISASQEIQIGDINGIFINDNSILSWNNINPTTITTNYLAADLNDSTTPLEIYSSLKCDYDLEVYGKVSAFGDRAYSAQYRTQLSESNTGFFVVEYSGDPNDVDELQNGANYAIKTKITETVADFATAVKFSNMDTTTRDALTAEAGMVIFNTSTSKLQVYDGSAWADLH